MAVDRQFKVLIVCTANECRSPYALNALSAQDVALGWRIQSAGTEVIDGTTACVEAGLGDTYHRSQSLSRELLADSDLVLGLERIHRTRAAEILPASRSRAFTLLEAVRFAGIVATGLETGQSQGDFRVQAPSDWKTLPSAGRLRWLVGEMNEARHFFDPLPGDIADAHGDNVPSHERVLTEIAAGVEQLVVALTRVLAGRGAGS